MSVFRSQCVFSELIYFHVFEIQLIYLTMVNHGKLGAFQNANEPERARAQR